jgi:uncharacterized protein YcgI (DUF1989 family)
MANTTGPSGQAQVNITANKTLAATDCGTVQNVVQDGLTITLPAAASGLIFQVRNGGVAPATGAAGAVSDGTVLVTVAPNGSDVINGLGFVATASKAALNTKATSKVGDMITLVGASGNWYINDAHGTWARQA